MFRRHCARIVCIFVAACISATLIVALSNPAAAGTRNIKKNSAPPPQSSVLRQTDTVTDTGTATLPSAEVVSATAPTLLDTIIEATADQEAAESTDSEVSAQPDVVSTESVSTESVSTELPSSQPALTDAAYAEAIDGTVVANRTSASVTFFVEGELYRLAPLRSLGIQLRRNPAPLNMFNCDADTPENESTCFWDPYLVEADGFYEVFNKSSEGAPLQLVLQAAGTPPSDRIWIQNRSGQRETLVFDNKLFELPPATVQEFEVAESSEVDFYRRSCISVAGETACEWIPQRIQTGFYYALSEITAVGGIANSEISTADIQPILAQDGDVIEQPRQIVCQVQVDKLNVRSGPGLNYLIVTSILLNGSATGN